MKNKNLLFTSAGDKTEFFNNWVDPNQEYDIYVCYYGNKTDKPYEKYCKYYLERKGSKFQNFYYVWCNDPIVKTYENYFIVDDDIIIKSNEINELYKILMDYNLYILQPSFKKGSKISHPITLQQSNNLLRYTNFIEVTAMMFPFEALQKCMDIYDPILVGWGIDYLFLWKLNHNLKNKFSIIDKISCINPKTPEDQREINNLQPQNIRKQTWETLAKMLNIKEHRHKTYKTLELIQSSI